MCRFYDPTAGKIQIGDYEIRDVTMSSLRSKFGAVPQVCFPLRRLAWKSYTHDVALCCRRLSDAAGLH